MRITRQEVEHVAGLARLDLTETELETMTGQLDRILDYVAQLGELDTSEVKPTSHAIPMRPTLREDVVVPGLSPADALANAPDRKGDLFRVPKIIE